MPGEHNSEENHHKLSELEVALSGLVPRADHFDRDRMMFLAGQASVGPTESQLASPPLEVRRQSKKQWAWPSAFAAMSCIAASLLVALVTHPAPSQFTQLAVSSPARQAAEAAATQAGMAPALTTAGTSNVYFLPDWLIDGFFPPPVIEAKHEVTYPELRTQLLTHGFIDSDHWASHPAAAGVARQEPILSREQWNHWMNKDGAEGGFERPIAPFPSNPLGGKS